MNQRQIAALALLIATALLGWPDRDHAADAAKPAEPGTLVLIDGADKEHKLKEWKFAVGTRHLSWLVPAPKDEPAPKDKPADKKGRPAPPPMRPTVGPEALEFREANSTNFIDGVLTLVPLDRIKSIDYSPAEDAVAVRVAAPKGDEDLVLTGTTKFARINKLTLAADVDRGDLGIAAVRFQGGLPKGIRGLRFAAPKEVAATPAGPPALVTLADKQKKPPIKVADLQPLYRLANGHEVLAPTLFFKKTLKLDVAKLRHLTAVPEGDEPTWKVALKDGSEESLSLLTTVPLDGREATLAGFLGRAPAGFLLFPLHTVAEVRFEPVDGGN